jgi:hypothetical protein
MALTNLGEFDLGTPIELANTFEAGDPLEPADPSEVRVRLLSPSGVTTVLTYLVDGGLSRVSEGLYRAVFLPDEAGVWGYRWIGSDDNASADSGRFIVTVAQA